MCLKNQLYHPSGPSLSYVQYTQLAEVVSLIFITDKTRMWVPFTFCWAFTCIRAKMIHYVDLRMKFLGGEDEELILIRMR